MGEWEAYQGQLETELGRANGQWAAVSAACSGRVVSFSGAMVACARCERRLLQSSVRTHGLRRPLRPCMLQPRPHYGVRGRYVFGAARARCRSPAACDECKRSTVSNAILLRCFPERPSDCGRRRRSTARQLVSQSRRRGRRRKNRCSQETHNDIGPRTLPRQRP
jgi:hypothetical protein